MMLQRTSISYVSVSGGRVVEAWSISAIAAVQLPANLKRLLSRCTYHSQSAAHRQLRRSIGKPRRAPWQSKMVLTMPPLMMPGNALYRAASCTVACSPPGTRKLRSWRPAGLECPARRSHFMSFQMLHFRLHEHASMHRQRSQHAVSPHLQASAH